MSWLVFTDLDGTLLDHRTYKYDVAMPSINLLKQKHIPIIIVTSKTRAEVDDLRRELDLNYPFITENGAAAYIPCDYLTETPEYPWQDLATDFTIEGEYFVHPFAPTLDFWHIISEHISRKFDHCCTPFSKMTAEQVSKLTGLTLSDAIKAKTRDYSDPLHWFGSDDMFVEFQDAMKEHDLEVVRGGRFVHLLKGTDKGSAVQWLVDFYRLHNKHTAKVMVLGDGGNDVSMLNVADVPVLIRSEFHDYPKLATPDVGYRTEGYGPSGWSEAIKKYIDKD